MSYKARINNFRRKLFRHVTRNVLKSHIDNGIKPEAVRKILIIRPNHRLGNLILITPLLQEVSSTFPKATIDLFVKGSIASVLFRNFSSVGSVYSLPKKPFKNLPGYILAWTRLVSGEYDLVINAVSNSSSGRLAAWMVNAPLKISGEPERDEPAISPYSNHIALRPVFSFRYAVSRLGIQREEAPLPNLDLRLSEDELAKGKALLHRLIANDKPTLALYTFATGAKCYSPEWWQSFYQGLQAAFESYNIIEILPVENVSQLDFRLTSFYSKDVREIAALIANTAAFIGADSGIMHLASASGAPTFGLFAVTDASAYRPYNPGSAAIDTRHGNMDEWIETVRRMAAQRESLQSRPLSS